MRILAVDDEPEVIDVVRLCFNLRWPEAEVIAATTGEEALAAVEGQAPDLVLLDIMLPDIDGFEVCEEVRRFSDVPIIPSPSATWSCWRDRERFCVAIRASCPPLAKRSRQATSRWTTALAG